MSMNEQAWCIKHGYDQTSEQHKRHKKERVHLVIKRKKRINKKQGKFEKSKKGNKDVEWYRCC